MSVKKQTLYISGKDGSKEACPQNKTRGEDFLTPDLPASNRADWIVLVVMAISSTTHQECSHRDRYAPKQVELV